MKKIFFCLTIFVLGLLSSPDVQAGDCKTRDKVDWQATISSATNVRIDCDDHKGPVGASVGVVPAGEVIRILEVDRYQENYIVETSVGTGFVFRSFLKDIQESPLVRSEPAPESQFSDVSIEHPYYQAIVDVKVKGIISGGPDGRIRPDEKINRVELAKILVEATTDDDTIASASLADGVYSDIDRKGWYRSYLELARQKGIMSGDESKNDGPRTIRPGASANGAEVAKMIAITFDLEIRPAKRGELWYKPYLESLKGLGALPYQRADHQVTRGEVMFMISTILNR
jgi:hypothetical protein